MGKAEGRPCYSLKLHRIKGEGDFSTFPPSLHISLLMKKMEFWALLLGTGLGEEAKSHREASVLSGCDSNGGRTLCLFSNLHSVHLLYIWALQWAIPDGGLGEGLSGYSWTPGSQNPVGC